MTNTWDYKFAFDIESESDVPREFRTTFEHYVASYGPPRLAFFSPAVKVSRFISSDWLPPRMILVFGEYLVLLSLEVKSDHINILEWSPEDLVGYGMADFLLSCWFTFYPGTLGESEKTVLFPSRASDKFSQLATILCRWCEPDDEGPNNSMPSLAKIPGIPKKFASILDDQIKVWRPSEFFYQPAMELRGRIRGAWANLLLMSGTPGVFVLSDSCRGQSSTYGTEITYLSLHRVLGVEYSESQTGDTASIQIRLRGGKGELSLTWPIFGGLKSYAQRWAYVTETLAKALNREYSRS